ncbi:MAG: hypothetical protein H0V92_11995 [Pseudonocardiales bacterium]|nr:hypothetical protein [Pseudonocardiales bacterium]
MKDLEQFLLDRAMEHDSPTLLFTLASEYLISAKTTRPGVVTPAKMVATARSSARALTWELVQHLITGQVREDLDELLRLNAGLGMTRLLWLSTAAVDATASAVKGGIAKLNYLRGMDAHRLDLSMLPPSGAGFWPRWAAAPVIKRCSGVTRIGGIRSWPRWWPSPQSISSMRWWPCSIRRSQRGSPGRSRRPTRN